jgi:hypothetical protein
MGVNTHAVSEGPMDDFRLPRPLVLVAVFLILLGVLSVGIVLYLAALRQGGATVLTLLGSITCLTAGWRLLRRDSRAWGMAITITGAVAGATILAILSILGSGKPMPMESFNEPTIILPASIAAALFVPLLLISLWSFFVLLRADVRNLY